MGSFCLFAPGQHANFSEGGQGRSVKGLSRVLLVASRRAGGEREGEPAGRPGDLFYPNTTKKKQGLELRIRLELYTWWHFEGLLSIEIR